MLGVGVGDDDRPHADPGSDADVSGVQAEERSAWAILASAHGLGPVGLGALVAAFGSARAVVACASGPAAAERLRQTPRPGPSSSGRAPVPDAVATAIVEAVAAGESTLRRLRELAIEIVTIADPWYPARLRAIALPPPVLYAIGDARRLDGERAVAVVGTRHPTSAGRALAGRISTALVASRAAVVSGLAYGIDGAAHEATLRAGGTTVAVIGGGHAVAAPAAHRRLVEAILASGGAVVSEHGPDVEPSTGTFPRRNRLISGLSDATVVVEAPARSGALITASWALEQGRRCFLVPGAIDAPASAGCLAFLREWPGEARIVAGIPQLIADLGFSDPAGREDQLQAATAATLGRTEALVAGALVDGLATVDELVAVTDLPVGAVLATLTLLERRGLAVGSYGRYRPAGTLAGDRRPVPRRRQRSGSTVAGSPDTVLP